MIIDKIPFEIDFPLNILKDKRVNFKNKKEREKILKRHIYYNRYGKVKNLYLEKRSKIFFNLAKELVKFLRKKYPSLDILSVSIFGSSLYSNQPGDFDFLIITKGNVFLYDETKLILSKTEEKNSYPVGISIKGIENFSNGIFDLNSKVSFNLQSQIIYRTAISLFRRHIPLLGYDFVKNKKTFLRNAYAQISDLLNNAYELYYIQNKRLLNNKERARKILSRIYESLSYMCFLGKDKRVIELKKETSIKIERGTSFLESKKFFDRIVILYRKKIKKFTKNFRSKKSVLKVLLNDKLKENIKKRLENYWKTIKLPYEWISPILEILSKYSYNEDLAMKEVRIKFPSITQKDSKDYSKKLKQFREIKVINLAKRMKEDIFGELIADVGGRSDDFVEQILLLKKSVKRTYVTDLCSFTKRSKNSKIHFVIQPSSTKMPFSKKSIDTIILSMVLHHLKRKNQKKMIKNLISYLNKDGKIILVEDTFPERISTYKYDKITKEFLKFKISEKKRILYFYDWFGNRLMRNRDNIPLFYNYKTMEEWKKIFEKVGAKEIKSEFIKENLANPDIFPPKAIMVFQKRTNN